MLRVEAVQKRLTEMLADRWSRLEMEEIDIIRELEKIGKSDLRLLFNRNGTFKHPHEWHDDVAGAVASLKVKELFDENGTLAGYIKEVKFWDKPNALKLLGIDKGKFIQKHEVKHELSYEELLEKTWHNEDQKKLGNSGGSGSDK